MASKLILVFGSACATSTTPDLEEKSLGDREGMVLCHINGTHVTSPHKKYMTVHARLWKL